MGLLDNLSGMPDWDDEFMSMYQDSEKEDWQPDATHEACKALYLQWRQVVLLLNGLLDSVTTTEDSFPMEILESQKEIVLVDAHEVAAKIRSSEAGGIYILRMENAAIIRKNAQFIKTSIAGMLAEEVIEEQHGELVRAEIDKFRELFKQWIATFKKDEFDDEWGLFV
ncbi:MAG: hypothetical protein J0I41_21475 [Filimonas sp.]|nr:hypothetical protein [Filimonas sp.]